MKVLRFASLIMLTLVIAGCNQVDQGANPMMGGGMAVPVEVTEVAQQDVQLYIRTNGETRASEFVQIPARVTGFLEEIYFEPGAIVKEGDPLFKIDQREYKAALDSAQAQLKLDKESEKLAKSKYERGKELLATNAISEEEFQVRESQYAQSTASVQKSQAAVEKAEIDFGYTMVYAPITGKTGWNLVDKGNLVGQNSILLEIRKYDPLFVHFEIADTDLNLFKIKMSGDKKSFLNRFDDIKAVRERESLPDPMKDSPKIAEPKEIASKLIPVAFSKEETETLIPATSENGTTASKDSDGSLIDAQPFTITLLSSRDISGENSYSASGVITMIDNSIRSTTGTITLRGELKNEDYGITPGQVCRVIIPAQMAKDAVVIREEAVVTDLDSKYVYVINVENKVEKRTISVGQLEGKMRIVLNGLKPGERYIVRGIQKVRQGAVVEPLPLSD